MSNQYSIGSALIVLEDEQSTELVNSQLVQLGITNIVKRDSGKRAWNASLAFPYDLIVMGWRLPEVSGVALFNRLRQAPNYYATPIIIVSSILRAEEFALLGEFPCSRLIADKLTTTSFTNTLTNVSDEAGWYRENAAMIESLIDFVEGNPEKILELIREPLAKAPNPAPLAVLASRLFRENGFLAEAERVMRDHVKKFPTSQVGFAELGRILHAGHRYEEAGKMLDKAHVSSPKNIARLCLLSDVDLTLANPTGALSRFARVLEIDETNLTGRVGVRLIKQQKGMAAATSAAHSLASMANMAAIVKIRRRTFEDGIEGYAAALNLVTSVEARMKVSFNMGLAYYKWGKTQQALVWLREACDLGEGKYERANKYRAYRTIDSVSYSIQACKLNQSTLHC